VIVDMYKGKRFNSPNDVIETKDGSLIFSDPPYGLMEGLGGPAEAELSFSGVYCVPAGSTEAILLVDDFKTPNGLALSTDEKILYVDDTEHGHIRCFDVGEDWTLTSGTVFAEFNSKEEDGPDGLKLDVLGNIFCTGPGGIWIISPDGILLGRILTPEIAANLNWGGKDLSTLFITASTSLFALQCITHG